MINGNSAILEFAQEETWGKKENPTQRVEFTSEGFNWVPNKTEEGLLTGGMTSGALETMSVSAEGSLSTIAKPETVGFFLKGALGVEEVEEAGEKYQHTFKAIGNTEADKLPSYTFTVDRIAGCWAYTGMKINSLSFSAAAEDRLKLDISMNGRTKEAGTINKALTAEKSKAFKFNQGSVIADGQKVGKITSVSLAYNNNLDTSTQTMDTGIYYEEPAHGMREITADIEVIYSSQIENFAERYWMNDTTLSLNISFAAEDGSELSFSLPACQITAFADPNASGAETLKQSFSVKAIDNQDDLIVVQLVNTRNQSY